MAWDFGGDGEDAAAALGGIESNAVDMGKFLSALESPPRGRLGEAIAASFVSGIGWDSDPGANLAWKNGMTGGYSAYLAFDRGARKAIYLGENSAVSLDDLGAFSIGSSAGDALLSRATPTRIATEDEISKLKGRFKPEKPGSDPAIPLAGIAVSESLGRMVARYDFGSVTEDALLVPSADDGVWNVIDGERNVDAVRVLRDGLRTTVTDETHTAVIELEKIPTELEQFPATE